MHKAAFSSLRTTPFTSSSSKMHVTLSVLMNVGPDTTTPVPPSLFPNLGFKRIRSVDKSTVQVHMQL